MTSDSLQALSSVIARWHDDGHRTCLKVYSALTVEGGCSKWEATCITVSLVVADFQQACSRLYEWLVERCLQPLMRVNWTLGATLADSLTQKSALGTGNPTVNRLASDYRMLGLNLWQELEMIAPSEIPELKKRLMKLVEIRNQTVHGRDPVVENWKGGLLETVFTPLDRLVRLIAELVAQYSESVVGRNSHG